MSLSQRQLQVKGNFKLTLLHLSRFALDSYLHLLIHLCISRRILCISGFVSASLYSTLHLPPYLHLVDSTCTLPPSSSTTGSAGCISRASSLSTVSECVVLAPLGECWCDRISRCGSLHCTALCVAAKRSRPCISPSCSGPSRPATALEEDISSWRSPLHSLSFG